MNNKKEILIIGAGSAGLSSALFLYNSGFQPRIIDKRNARLKITKALGVNPNTLRLFETTEITKRFLENGWKCSCMNIRNKDRIIYRNDFTKIKHPYPFMLIQPQFETEQIIEEALEERKIFVERNLGLEEILEEKNKTQMSFRNAEGQVSQMEFEGIVIGADGSKSKVRESLGIEFEGWEHDEEFKLYDIELETSLSEKEGHYILHREGGMLMLHIRDGVWRTGGNIKDVLNYLPKGTRTGKISWETSFTVGEKVANKFSVGNVYLLGDAAHVHSPVGAKGMNMCIEDGHIFSGLIKDNREKTYHDVRHSTIKKTVGILGQLTDKIGGQNFIGNTIRNNLNMFSFLLPVVMPGLRKFLLGLK